MAQFATSVPVAHTMWPTVAAFVRREVSWQATPGNELQELILRLKEPSLDLAATMDEKVLRAIASDRAVDINEFLKREGFQIQLTDMGSLNMLYAASVMKLIGKWLESGQTNYYLPSIRKPAFRLTGCAHYEFQGQRIVSVPTRSNFSFLVTRPTGAHGWNMLLDWARMILKMTSVQGNGAVLSMAEIGETKIDVKGLVGMVGGEWQIQEALMAAKFGLTPEMVKFESAFAMSASRGGPMCVNEPEQGDYIADHDLYFALARPGHLLPVVVGLVPTNELANQITR